MTNSIAAQNDPQRGYPTPTERIDTEKHGAQVGDLTEPAAVAYPCAPPVPNIPPIIDLTALPRTYLLDEAQTARVLGAARGTLSVWRSTGRWNLPFVKVGRSVKYRVGDLLDFIDRRTRVSGATE